MTPRLERSNRPKAKQVGNVAGAYLALLADRGVDYLFGNAGTDFAPLIEAYAQAARTGVAVPRPILATHENLAVAMAHGYGMVSRRIPAVMAHVSVGTANMICAMPLIMSNTPGPARRPCSSRQGMVFRVPRS